jgi:thiamine monophosphate kinase
MTEQNQKTKVLDPRVDFDPACSECLGYANSAAEIDVSDGAYEDLVRAADRVVAGFNRHFSEAHKEA